MTSNHGNQAGCVEVCHVLVHVQLPQHVRTFVPWLCLVSLEVMFKSLCLLHSLSLFPCCYAVSSIQLW